MEEYQDLKASAGSGYLLATHRAMIYADRILVCSDVPSLLMADKRYLIRRRRRICHSQPDRPEHVPYGYIHARLPPPRVIRVDDYTTTSTPRAQGDEFMISEHLVQEAMDTTSGLIKAEKVEPRAAGGVASDLVVKGKLASTCVLPPTGASPLPPSSCRVSSGPRRH